MAPLWLAPRPGPRGRGRPERRWGLGAAVSSRGPAADQGRGLEAALSGRSRRWSSSLATTRSCKSWTPATTTIARPPWSASLARLALRSPLVTRAQPPTWRGVAVARPENRPYAAGVQDLVLDASLAGCPLRPRDWPFLPARRRLVRRRPVSLPFFLAATGCYAAPDGQGRYGRRVAALASRHLGSRPPLTRLDRRRHPGPDDGIGTCRAYLPGQSGPSTRRRRAMPGRGAGERLLIRQAVVPTRAE